MTRSTRARRFAALTLAAIAAAAPAGAQEIGSVAASRPNIEGTPPGTSSRTLEMGATVVTDERVVTSDNGSGQLVFLDQTALTVSPGSDLVLDSYVYDPAQDTGEIALTFTKGVMRFIGGRITKTSAATVATPHATIGVRGGIAAIVVEEGRTRATLLAGEAMTVTGRTETVTVSRNNATVEVQAPEGGGGGEPSFTGLADAGAMRALFEAAAGRTPGAGEGTGVEITPTQVSAVAAGTAMAEVGALKPGAAASTPVSTLGEQASVDSTPLSTEAAQAAETEIADRPVQELVATPTPTRTPEPRPIRNATAVAWFATRETTTDDFDQVIENPDAVGEFIVGATRRIYGDVLAGSVIGRGRGQADLRIPTPSQAGFYTFGDLQSGPTLAANGRGPRGPISGRGFHDPEQAFTVAAFRGVEDGRGGIAMFGRPTPGQLGESFDRAIPARVYSVSRSLIHDREAPLPQALRGDIALDGGDLFLLPGPNQTFGAQNGVGFGSGSFAKIGLGFVGIEGEGRNQRSIIGGLTGEVLPDGQGGLTSSSLARSFFNLGDEDIVGRSFGTLNPTQDRDGNVFFGDDGQYVLLTGESRFHDASTAENNDPDRDAATGFWQYFDRDLLTPDVDRATEFEGGKFGLEGDARLAILDRKEQLGGFGRRLPLAGEIFEGSDVPLDFGFFDGGYVAAQGQTRNAGAPTLAGVLPPPYVLRSNNVDSVQMLFFPGTNSAFAEFVDVDAVNRPALRDMNVFFGDSGNRSLFVDDERFVMRRWRTDEGPLSGAPLQFAGTSRTTSDQFGQTTFRGVLASAGIAGDGGVFPDGVDTSPRYMRWGWWGGVYRFPEDLEQENFRFRREFFPLGAWVTGVRSRRADLDARGTARFEGLAVAQIAETGRGRTDLYVDGGSYRMNFDFAERTGRVVIDDIAPGRFTANVSEERASTRNHFGGALRDRSGARAGRLDGSFFRGGGRGAAAAGGAFDFETRGARGTTLTGAGVFAGDRR